MLKELIVSMRPKQWYKNLILFVCLVFSANLFNVSMWYAIIAAFVIFCILSGSDYTINDVIDRKKDREHPTKSKRPIAAGKLNVGSALFFAIVFIILSLYWAYTINLAFFGISLVFFIAHTLYSSLLKKFVIVDVLTISVNFIIRAIAGCLAISVFISPWLIICTFLLALLLALGKRRMELILLGKKAEKHRNNLKEYSMAMLDQMINITAGALVISYSLYTFLADKIYLMFTIPFALYGIFRYLLLLRNDGIGENPELLFKDLGMLICLILWIIVIIFVFYI